ncbi:hypothetical protein SRHO_G00310820 [Serrasalmus rhombeus]
MMLNASAFVTHIKAFYQKVSGLTVSQFDCILLQFKRLQKDNLWKIKAHQQNIKWAKSKLLRPSSDLGTFINIAEYKIPRITGMSRSSRAPRLQGSEAQRLQDLQSSRALVHQGSEAPRLQVSREPPEGTIHPGTDGSPEPGRGMGEFSDRLQWHLLGMAYFSQCPGSGSNLSTLCLQGSELPVAHLHASTPQTPEHFGQPLVPSGLHPMAPLTTPVPRNLGFAVVANTNPPGSTRTLETDAPLPRLPTIPFLGRKERTRGKRRQRRRGNRQ